VTELSDVVIVGASLAGLRAAQTLRAEGYVGALTVVGEEEPFPYDRPPLSKEVLRGEATDDDIALSGVTELKATWKLGAPAIALDPVHRVIALRDGAELPYGAAVLATGSGVRMVAPFALGDAGVHVLRTLADARRLRKALVAGGRVLIVGCGFVGVEVASSARALGVEVAMVSLEPPLALAGRLVSETATGLIRQSGIDLCIGHAVASATRTDDRYAVVLSDGTSLVVDDVVVAVGSTPNTGWLAGAGADLTDGVLCDEALRVVGLEDVVAAGDIVRWPNAAFADRPMRIEHWSNAVEQGGAAARSLIAGDAAVPFGSVPSFWSDHFGTRLQSVGLPQLADRFELLGGEPSRGVFAAAGYAGDVLVAGVAYGMPRALVPVRIALSNNGVNLG
jgi:3-phenylpropionate/trans-cinnamate dioxygenase ferredoxin reductase component